MRPIGGWLCDRLRPIPVLATAFAVVATFAVLAAFQLPLIPVATIAFLGMAAALRTGTGSFAHRTNGCASHPWPTDATPRWWAWVRWMSS